MEEKNISYTLHEVDVTNGEQCSNWFMQMNPKSDVPVLQIEALIVPTSNEIINYLEVNFNDGKATNSFKFLIHLFIFLLIETHASLLPMKDVKLRNKIVNLHRRISQIPIGVISLGSILHPELVSCPGLPFVGPLRSGILRKLLFDILQPFPVNSSATLFFFNYRIRAQYVR